MKVMATFAPALAFKLFCAAVSMHKYATFAAASFSSQWSSQTTFAMI
jgi:hypothetical protein